MLHKPISDATSVIGCEYERQTRKNNKAMAEKINKTIRGASLNRRQTPITQHRFKLITDARFVRNGLVNFYKDVVATSGKALIPDKELTRPTDLISIWFSRRTEDEINRKKVVHDKFSFLPRVYPTDPTQPDCVFKETDDAKPWLCLNGTVGNGKTTMLRAISELITNIHNADDGKYHAMAPFSHHYITATDLADIFLENKATYNGIRNTKLLLIDDVGREPKEIVDYGNTLYPFIDMMQYRYNNGLGTIFTTNLTGPQLRERYGERIADRMRECCYFVEFRGNSFRPRQ